MIIDGEYIQTIPEHPFYVEGRGWVEAGDLEIGMFIRQSEGDPGMVWLQWATYRQQEMYNLTVGTAHTFFVGDGQWLVHNDCWKIGPDGNTPVNPGEPGYNLAQDAKDLYGQLTMKEAKRTTIALGQMGDEVVIAVNSSAPPGVAQKLGALQGSTEHAEEYLLKNFGDDLTAIGISNRNGSCPNCYKTFSQNNYWNLYFDDAFR